MDNMVVMATVWLWLQWLELKPFCNDDPHYFNKTKRPTVGVIDVRCSNKIGIGLLASLPRFTDSFSSIFI